MTTDPASDITTLLQTTGRQRVSDGAIVPILQGTQGQRLVLVWPQLGDFDSLEYAWWLQRDRDRLQARSVTVRAVGIGDRAAGEQFCRYTGFPPEALFVDPTAQLHQALGLYPGLQLKVPGLSSNVTGWLNLLLMCAGIGSPGTLAEVFRGYLGDRQAPQLIGAADQVQAWPLPVLSGRSFDRAGGTGFQRPFELATLRLRNMVESLKHWDTYVPDASYLPQRGGTFLLGESGELIYAYRDRGLLGFAATMANPLAFL